MFESDHYTTPYFDPGATADGRLRPGRGRSIRRAAISSRLHWSSPQSFGIWERLKFNSLAHYVSEDLVHWQMWPTGPKADAHPNVGGIWLLHHRRQRAAVRHLPACGADGEERGIRARSHDGMISFTDKVVLPHHHDGHGWREGDTWYVITMYRARGKIGSENPEIVIFSSPDLDHWTERGLLSRPRDYLDKQQIASRKRQVTAPVVNLSPGVTSD